jgi:two-component system NtrC family sensor kinase
LERRVKERTLALEQAIQRLQETQAQLIQSEKLATIGTLAGGVAHELNNPLSAILANAQLLAMDFEEDEEHSDAIQLIEAGAKRCKAIVENLLNYARRSGPELRSLSVNKVLEDTLAMLNHQLKHANVELVKELAPEVPPVRGIANELGQVFTNLIVNALDAVTEVHPKGGGRLHMSTALEKGMIVVAFEDNGPGMDASMLRKIFDPFFTTKEVGKGTGLGLAISQQIAGSFGGRVEVRSERGVGTCFRVVLPLAANEPGQSA